MTLVRGHHVRVLKLFSFIGTIMPVKSSSQSSSETFEITFTHWASDGTAEGLYEGKRLHLAQAFPGETFRLQRTTHGKTFTLTALARLTQSPYRRSPTCRYLEDTPPCGGCLWGALAYEEQCRQKEAQLLAALAHEGVTPPTLEPFLGAKQTQHYRSKNLFIPIKTEDHWAWGFYASGSHQKVATPECQAIAPWMNEVAGLIAHALEKSSFEVYNEADHTGDVRGLLLREGALSTTERLVALILRTRPNEAHFTLLRSLADSLSRSHGIKAFLLNINPERGNALLGTENLALTDEESISTDIDGLTFSVGVNTFLQIHREQMLALYREALNWASITPETRFMDLYCGVGTLTLLGARQAKHAVGVEAVEPSIVAARENARRNALHNTTFYCVPVEKALGTLIAQGERPDIIMADPAFKGMAENVPALLAASGAKRVVYISCNPKSFARDARALIAHGFKLTRLRAVDLFPDTPHVETLGCFERA